MPELGKYAATVLLAYGVSLLLIAGIILLSLWQSARMRAKLRDVEGRRG